MNPAAWVLLGSVAVAGVTDWVAVARQDRRLELVAKPATTVLLLAVALVIDPVEPAQRTAFAVGLAASLAGDVALMLDRFLTGLGAFLVAHLAYVTGFLARDLSPVLLGVGAVVVLAGATPVVARIVRSLGVADRRLRAPVIAYAVVISAMVTVAAGTGVAVAVTGAVVFYASDGLIGWHRFVRPVAWAPVAIMVTYHVGQTLLVVSLAV